MYQAVFLSVVGVVLVIKIVFLVASIWFTLKYENQGNRRDSIISVATTLSFQSLESESTLAERSDGDDVSAGKHSRVNFLEYSRGDLGEYSEGIFGEHSRHSFGEPSTSFEVPSISFGEPSSSFEVPSISFGDPSTFEVNGRSFEDGDLGKLRIDNLDLSRDTGKNNSDQRGRGNSEHDGRRKRRVLFLDPIAHTVLRDNSNAFYDDSFV